MNTPWFRLVMTRDRFKKIRAFHVVDNSTIPSKDDPADRPSCRVRPLLDYINTVCMHYFMPGQAIAIDESLIAGKVRNPIRQYLPNKHHARFGTKVWFLADSEHVYVLKCMLLVQGVMLSIVWWKWETCLTIVIICLRTIYLQPAQQQVICWNEALFWQEQWDEISYSIYQMKLLLLSQRLEKKFIAGRRDTLPCHIDKNNLKASLLLCYQFFVGHLMFHIGKRQTKQFQQ